LGPIPVWESSGSGNHCCEEVPLDSTYAPIEWHWKIQIPRIIESPSLGHPSGFEGMLVPKSLYWLDAEGVELVELLFEFIHLLMMGIKSAPIPSR